MPNRQTALLLLAGLMLEIVGLEISPSGLVHHLWDASAIAIYVAAAGWISGRRRARWLMAALGVVAWSLDFLSLKAFPVDTESLFWAALHFTLAGLLAHRLFHVRTVGLNEILYSLALYVLMAIAFANAYSIVLWNFPNAITYPNAVEGQAPQLDQVLYYSCITQLTVGYGDMAPNHPVTRVLSIAQAFFGVMYVAILMARFVSLHTNEQMSQTAPPKDGSGA